MQRKYLIIGVVVVAVFALLFFVSRGKDAEPTTIVSQDGILTLSLPEGALPEGVAVEDIRIEPTTESAIRTELGLEPAEEEGTSSLVAYNLLPDGLSFLEPVTVTLESETSTSGVIPAIFHVADGEFEIISDTKVIIDLDENQVLVSGEITHFSVVGSDLGRGMFNYTLTAGGRGIVGDSFPYSLAITPTQDFTWFKYGGGIERQWGYDYRMAPGTTWDIAPFIVMTRHEGVIEPVGIPSPRTSLGGFDTFTLDGSHTCVEEGTNELVLPPPERYFIIEYRMEREFRKHGGGTGISYQNASTWMRLKGSMFTCASIDIIEVEDEDTDGVVGTSGLDFTGDHFKVLVIESVGNYYPVSQFIVADGPDTGCTYPHYRAKHDTIYGLKNLTDTTIVQTAASDVSGCGFGRFDSLERINAALSFDQVSALRERIPDRL